jgi:hypothetical protein
MNFMLVIVAVMIGMTAGRLINNPRWHAFLERHNKKYEDEQHHLHRFALWSKCEQKVAEMNARPGRTYTAACPHFADWTEEEKQTRLFGAKHPGRQFNPSATSLNVNAASPSIPSSIGK